MGIMSRFLDDWRFGSRWPDDMLRRRSIIRAVAPIILDAGRPVTPEMIDRFMSETVDMSPVNTGRKVHDLLDAELAQGG